MIASLPFEKFTKKKKLKIDTEIDTEKTLILSPGQNGKNFVFFKLKIRKISFLSMPILKSKSTYLFFRVQNLM